jgi:ring-1,2-phenylacetyl-CoA epoxidase subunit PaaC
MAQFVAKIQREEAYHLMHVQIWLERLANSTPEARQRLEQALESLWPDALGMFEEFPDEQVLLEADILTAPSAQLQQRWLAAIAPAFERLCLPFPLTREASTDGARDTYRPQIAPRVGGRHGLHTADFSALWEQMTMVYRLDPQASW